MSSDYEIPVAVVILQYHRGLAEAGLCAIVLRGDRATSSKPNAARSFPPPAHCHICNALIACLTTCCPSLPAYQRPRRCLGSSCGGCSCCGAGGGGGSRGEAGGRVAQHLGREVSSAMMLRASLRAHCTLLMYAQMLVVAYVESLW